MNTIKINVFFLSFLLLAVILPLKVHGVDCTPYGSWSSGGQVANGYVEHAGSLYQNNGSNGWDGAGHNPAANPQGDWTLIGVCGNEPVVTTNAETAVTSSTMTLNGTVTSNSGFALTDRGFIYGTNSANVTSSTTGALVGTSVAVSEGGTTVAAYSQAVTGLCPGITYYIKAYAINSQGEGYGSNETAVMSTPGVFTTVQDGPFTNAATWGGCGAPDLTAGHTINVGHAVTSGNLTLTESTDLVVTTGGVLTTTGTITLGGTGGITTVTVDVGGTLNVTNIGFTNASVFTSNGTLNVTSTITIEAVATVNLAGTATIATVDNNNGNLNQTDGTVDITGNYDCSNDCDFDQSGGAMTVGGNFKVWGSGESHMDGTLDITGTVIMDNNGYMDGTGVIAYGTSDVNPNNSSAYISCDFDGSRYDDNVLSAEGNLPHNPWNLGTCGAGTLPVEILSFTANRTDATNIACKWVTGVEINNDYFNVMGSSDGAYWDVLGVVQGAGSSNKMRKYEFVILDVDEKGIKLIRLRQVDFDGNQVLYKILKVEASEKSKGSISIFPNPVRDVLSMEVNVLDSGKYNMQILSSQGLVVENMDIFIQDRGNEINLLISGLENGLYSVVFSDRTGQRFSKRFLKN